MICNFCKGHQNLFWLQKQVDRSSTRNCLICPPCSGDGTINADRKNKTIMMHTLKSTVADKQNIFSLKEHPNISSIVSALGIFPSVTQARKNGFDKPTTLGEYVFTKRKIKCTVVE